MAILKDSQEDTPSLNLESLRPPEGRADRWVDHREEDRVVNTHRDIRNHQVVSSVVALLLAKGGSIHRDIHLNSRGHRGSNVVVLLRDTCPDRDIRPLIHM